MVLRALVLFTAMVLTTHNAHAWSTRCTNGSCEATEGKLAIYWAADSMSDIYQGKLTGIEGVPVTIEDFEATEKKIDQMFEKATTSKKTGSAEVKGASEEIGGPSAGVSGNQEMAFTKKRGMSQSKTAGKKVTMDYGLTFIKWLGDTRFSSSCYWKSPGDIGQYACAAEYALQAYMDGTIQADVESFFFQKDAGRVEDVPIDATLNDDNKDLVLTKYIGLTKVYKDDPQVRYAVAHQEVMKLLYSQGKESTEELKKVNEEYQKQMEGLQVLIKPNQTALKLHKKDNDLAFAKWIGDNIISIQTYPSPKDRYTIALDAVSKYSDTEEIKKNRTDFEKSIQNKDQSVQIVTFKGPKIPPFLIGGLALPFFGVGGYWYWRKRRKKPEAAIITAFMLLLPITVILLLVPAFVRAEDKMGLCKLTYYLPKPDKPVSSEIKANLDSMGQFGDYLMSQEPARKADFVVVNCFFLPNESEFKDNAKCNIGWAKMIEESRSKDGQWNSDSVVFKTDELVPYIRDMGNFARDVMSVKEAPSSGMITTECGFPIKRLTRQDRR